MRMVMLLLGLALVYGRNASAYEVETHKTITRFSGRTSSLNMSATLEQLGLVRLDLYDSKQSFPSYPFDDFALPKSLSIGKLIEFGAGYEDERRFIQAIHHFYNPADGRAPTVGGSTPGKPSPDWALEDKEEIGDQPFSYKKARNYLFDALTLPSKVDRDKNWGKTFQTVGHVIHHLQDMAQPQHVRNDPHCDKVFHVGS